VGRSHAPGATEGLARVVANHIRRATTLSRHVLSELDKLGLPWLRTVLSEAVAYGEISFSGALPREGKTAGAKR
jgi:chromosome partitioning protein